MEYAVEGGNLLRDEADQLYIDFDITDNRVADVQAGIVIIDSMTPG